MRIGIDIDGVLTDIEQWQLDYGSKFYYEKYSKEIIDWKGYETTQIFNVSQKYDDEFWVEYFRDYSTNVEARKFASEIIDKLMKENNEIYIITARNNQMDDSTELMGKEECKDIVKNWLEKNKIRYSKLIFTPEDKLDVCMKNNIDLMIEDNVNNIERISTKIPVICFNAGYNEKCKGKNIIRCYSWYDIYSKINKML